MNAQEKVLNACQKLWHTRGVRDFTMDELAAEAGLSKRTVYKYFRSKEEIIEAVVDQMISDICVQSDRFIDEGLRTDMVIVDTINYLFQRASFLTNKRSLEDVSRYYPHIWDKINKFRAERLDYAVKIMISKNPDSNLQSLDIRIVQTIIKSAIINVLDPQFILENGFTFQEAAQQVSRILIHMFMTPGHCYSDVKAVEASPV